MSVYLGINVKVASFDKGQYDAVKSAIKSAWHGFGNAGNCDASSGELIEIYGEGSVSLGVEDLGAYFGKAVKDANLGKRARISVEVSFLEQVPKDDVRVPAQYSSGDPDDVGEEDEEDEG